MPVEVTVRFWAGARRAAGHESERLTAETIGEVRAALAGRPELAKICAVASFLMDGQQAGDTTPLRADAVVDVLPPFAGGSDVARMHAWVSGRVQAVGFRAWTRSAARRVGVGGWAANLPDGRVEVVASGPRAACEQFLAALRGADAPGVVSDIRVEWDEPSADLSTFEIR